MLGLSPRRASVGAAAVVVALGCALTVARPADGALPVGAPAMPQPVENPVLAPFPSNGDGGPTAKGVSRALAPALAQTALGPTKLVAVYDASSGKLIYQQGQQQPAMPASTNKVLTAAAVLTAYGSDYRITTRTASGPNPSDVVLVGGGDPLLQTQPAEDPLAPDAPASLTELAKRTATELAKRTDAPSSFVVRYDGSLFSGPRAAPSWPSSYVSEGLVSPITALMTDGGGTASPSLTAAQNFADLLREQGVKVRAVGGPVDVGEAAEIAAVRSAPLSTAVGVALERSDNTVSEVLAHLAGAKQFGTGSFQTGAQAVISTLTELEVPVKGVRLYDGSGLSRDNRVPPVTIAATVNRMAQNSNPQLWAATYGLPVAGFTGTLDDRFVSATATSGRGEVRAKTGTLTGESSLAGLVTTIDGDLLTFVFNAPATPNLFGAQNAWDDAAAALARCGCQ